MPRKNSTPKTKRRTATIRELVAEEKKNKKAARHVIDLFDKTNCPDFVTNAVMDALIKASELKGVHVWHEDGNFDETALANLFCVTQRLDLDRNPTTPRGRLAAALAEIMSNDLTPERLHRDVGNFITDISTQLLDDSEEMIDKALAFGNCGFVKCPGRDEGTVCPGPESHEESEGVS